MTLLVLKSLLTVTRPHVKNTKKEYQRQSCLNFPFFPCCLDYSVRHLCDTVCISALSLRVLFSPPASWVVEAPRRRNRPRLTPRTRLPPLKRRSRSLRQQRRLPQRHLRQHQPHHKMPRRSRSPPLQLLQHQRQQRLTPSPQHCRSSRRSRQPGLRKRLTAPQFWTRCREPPRSRLAIVRRICRLMRR